MNYRVTAIFDAVDNVTKTVERIVRSLDSVGRTMRRVGTVASGALTAPLTALGISSVNTALDVDRLTRTLEGLAGSAEVAAEYVSAIEGASRGTIASVDALAVANRALSFGIVQNADEMAQLTEIAIALGRAQGLDAAQAVSDLTTALARQSPMILDNLGISLKLSEAYAIYAESIGKTVDQLTDAEKAEAFRQAALIEGMRVVERMGGIQEDAASAVERLNARFRDAKAAIGAALLPMLERLLGFVQPLVDWFASLDENTMRWVATIGVIVAAAGPVLVILGTLISSLTTVGGVLAGIGAPVLLVVGAVAALGVAFATNWGGIRDRVMEAWDAIQPILSEIWSWLQEAIPAALDYLRGWFADVWSQIQPTVIEAVGNIQAKIAELQPIFNQLQAGAASVVAWFVENWPLIQAAIQQVMDVVGGIIANVVNEVVPFIVEMFGKVVDWVVENWPLIQETVSTVLGAVWAVVSAILGAIRAIWAEHGDAILNAVSLTWDSIKTIIGTALDVVLGLIRAAMQVITGDWEGAWETVKGVFISVWNALQRLLRNYFNTLLGYFDTSLDDLTAMVAAKIVDIIEAIRAKIAAFRDMGRRLIEGLKEGVLNAVGGLISAVTGAVGSAIDAAKQLLGVSSPSRLFAWIGQMTMLGMADGILAAQEAVVKAAMMAMHKTYIAGVAAQRSAIAASRTYDQRSIINSQSTVNVNGVGLGMILGIEQAVS